MPKTSKLAKFYPALILGYAFLPLAASAQTLVGSSGILTNFRNLINTVIGLLFSVAVLIFLWGVVQFIAKSGDEAGRTKAKGIMTWGIVGLVVMASVWGILNALVAYFGTGVVQPGTGVIPEVPSLR